MHHSGIYHRLGAFCFRLFITLFILLGLGFNPTAGAEFFDPGDPENVEKRHRPVNPPPNTSPPSSPPNTEACMLTGEMILPGGGGLGGLLVGLIEIIGDCEDPVSQE